MRYYVVADVHGFYTELKTALKEKGFFDDKGKKKLIICGDLFDRGNEARALQEFVLELMEKKEIILIRGNHEDLMLLMIKDWANQSYSYYQHQHNGTVDTALQLSGEKRVTVFNQAVAKEKLKNTPFIKQIIPKMRNYFETEHYIFVHGWIPCSALEYGGKAIGYAYQENWRNLSGEGWDKARWYNGMEAHRQGVVEPNKTIVCGHWHCSYGHAVVNGECSEWGDDADFSTYTAEGIIALDACTARTGKVNCVVIED